MYLEYHELKKKYNDAEKNYYDALDKKTKLLYSVTPHGTEVKEIVNHLSNMTPDEGFNLYTQEIQEVDLLINSTRNNRDALEHELKKKEIKLRESNDIYDKIYVYIWIEHKKSKNICQLIGYSRRQTDRKIEEIENILYPDLKAKREQLRKIKDEKRQKEQEKLKKIFKN